MIDPLRHLAIFDPDAFGPRRVDVIGVGATGSKVVLELAKLGIVNIHVWDYDKVEEHNVPNQVFGNDHVGMFKVDAISKIVKAQTGIDLVTHNEEVDGTQTFGDIVFLLTDTMKSRKSIFERGIKYKFNVKLMIETRMGKDSGQIYSIIPTKPDHIKNWENSLFSDDDKDTEVSLCGSTITVGSTAGIISGLAVWKVIEWLQHETGKLENGIANETMIDISPKLAVYQNKY